MTKATTVEDTRARPSGEAEVSSHRMKQTSVINSISALFTMTVVRQAMSRRLLILGVLYVLPIVLVVLMRQNGAGFRSPTAGYETDFAEVTLIFYMIPHTLVPLTALVYASGMIQDEIEEQTITYLLIRPLPKWSIYVAKLLATMIVTIGLTAAFTAVTFLVIGWGQADYWSSGGLSRMFKTMALFALSLTAYCALFGLMSMMMRRAILLGILYIIVLEGFMGNIDFVIRKCAVVYHFRVMAVRWMELGHADKFQIDLATAPSLRDSLLVLLGTFLTSAVLAALLMNTREFRVKTPEGS
jgi:ABC-2 type transport system permease protein